VGLEDFALDPDLATEEEAALAAAAVAAPPPPPPPPTAAAIDAALPAPTAPPPPPGNPPVLNPPTGAPPADEPSVRYGIVFFCSGTVSWDNFDGFFEVIWIFLRNNMESSNFHRCRWCSGNQALCVGRVRIELI